jgi:hypothetical protein
MFQRAMGDALSRRQLGGMRDIPPNAPGRPFGRAAPLRRSRPFYFATSLM